ncbi:MAG: bifunctional (p)ppGpp synthetase/guanosine-3',5'-bis(diphosphate) 3'-pyrophosphohydrolase [Paludibacteraceae bacterium]|nr:bifunctional (p)ppGpp synthetase/guanosine-3',5'-bis(diphosphate) 3'-pyrophosphohydrolase [Paludibacteraceae bacterium]
MDMKERLKFKFKSLMALPNFEFSKEEVSRLEELIFACLERESEADFINLEKSIDVAFILSEEVNLGKVSILGLMLHTLITLNAFPDNEIEASFGIQVASIVKGLQKASELNSKEQSYESENFRKLLLTLVEDIRVVIILICNQLYEMRQLSIYEEDTRMKLAKESSFLYAPLAHRLGLYRIKSELEDLSLKQTNLKIYKEIAHKLKETKSSRDLYIQSFIEPLKEKLEKAGFKFSIKGRTKSIYSIWNKMRKQNTAFENIYDLFAIRIILDSPSELEHSECWQVYSIITDMYQPNPKRLRDWLSIPKSNGYESLHITVMGPEGKWVEVQIRTVRMDEVAEKGFAAHFKYKGIKGEAGLDSWLANVRELLENPSDNDMERMDDFKLNLYNKEIFVFTPKGDLQQMPKGATLLDFAFLIHSNIGCRCIGGKVNGKNVSLRYLLNNGDQVEVLTAANQTPKKEWLNFVQTTKAKTRIRQFLREQEASNMALGKELLKRRLKNWKLEYDEAIVFKIAKKFGFKNIHEFYQCLAEDKIEVSRLKDIYILIRDKDNLTQEEQKSTEGFEHKTELENISLKEDVLVIDNHLQGIQYNLARCCNPIYGDDIFGFVSVSGGIKIHKTDCPNAPQMMSRFGYRFIKARWAGKSGSQYSCTLKVIGNDDIGIVTNITSLIQKESNVALRSISVDSADGFFHGHLTILISDNKVLENIIKKIKAIKGVKSVER